MVALTDDVKLRNWNKIKTCHFSTDKLTPGNALSPLILTDIAQRAQKSSKMAKVVENIHSLDFYSVHAKFKHLREYKDFRARTLQKQHF